jgi:hypothetical protein
MKYQWTDWITHVPGQELLIGTYALFEFQGTTKNAGQPYEKEGAVTAAHNGHPCWRLSEPNGRWCRINRYKLRSIAIEETAERELEVAK